MPLLLVYGCSQAEEQCVANSDASLQAYQSGVGDVTSLMRAQITEYELQLDHARARVDQLMTRARLLYLSGDRS